MDQVPPGLPLCPQSLQVLSRGRVVEGHPCLAIAKLEMGIWWSRERWQG